MKPVPFSPFSTYREESARTTDTDPLTTAPSNTDFVKHPPPSKSSWKRTGPSLGGLRRRLFPRQYWMTEIIALVFGLVFIVIIVSVLHTNDSRPIEEWDDPGGITLNALLSLMVTLLYMALIAPLSTCVSQLCWTHFQSPRPLSDFSLYDRASHNVFTALAILLNPGQSPLITMAAALLVLITAIGPLTQQILSVTTLWRQGPGDASLPICQDFSLSRATDGGANSLQEQSLYQSQLGLNQQPQALYTGAFGSRVVDFSVNAQCPSSNCSWPDYATLMFRSTTTDMTRNAAYMDVDTVSSLLANWSAIVGSGNESSRGDPDSWSAYPLVRIPTSNVHAPGLALGFITSFVFTEDMNVVFGDHYTFNLSILMARPYSNFTNLNGTIIFNKNIAVLDVYYQEMIINGTRTKAGLSDASVAYGKGGAWESVFDLVAQPYRAQQVNGTLNETPAGTPIVYSGPSCTAPSDMIIPTCALKYTWENQVLSVDSWSASNLGIILETFFDGYAFSSVYSHSRNQANRPAGDGPSSLNASSLVLSYLYSAAVGEVYGEAGSNQDILSPPSAKIGDVMSGVAASLTQSMRSNEGTIQSGTVWAEQNVYTVTWGWLVIPLALLVLTCFLVAATAWDTHRKDLPAWTDSSLAVMVHGVDNYSRLDLVGIRNADELESESKRIFVCLNKETLMLETV